MNVKVEKLELDVFKGHDKIDKTIYDPRNAEGILQKHYPGAEIVSNTLPKPTQKNVKLAGGRRPDTGIVCI